MRPFVFFPPPSTRLARNAHSTSLLLNWNHPLNTNAVAWSGMKKEFSARSGREPFNKYSSGLLHLREKRTHHNKIEALLSRIFPPAVSAEQTLFLYLQCAARARESFLLLTNRLFQFPAQ